MISSFGKFAKSIGAKIVLTVLGLSMIVFWGLGGLTNLSLSRNKPAIEIGSKNISLQQLAAAFDKERQRMGTLMGGTYISPADGIKNGLLDTAVQGQIISGVSAQVRDELGLSASDAAVRKYVERNPAFADNLGNFDRGIFYAYLSQIRMSETELAYKLRDELAMEHLNGTVRELGYNPQILAEAVYKYKNEKRSANVMTINPQDIKITETPSNEELREYYEAYADRFILPEYRTVQIVHITPENIAENISIDSAAIDEAYEQKKSSLGTPEKRLLDQILVDSEEDGQAILSELTPDNFRQSAQEKAGQSEAQTDFGWVGKDDIMTELAEAVFDGQKNQIVGPIQTSLGWHIMLIRDIQAAQAPNEEQAKAEIKKQLASEQAYEQTEEIVRRLEDALGQGDTLIQAAQSLSLPIKKLGTFDITGTKPDGVTLDETYKSATLLQDIFLLNPNETSSVIEFQNGYIVAEVTDVIASAPQEFDDAKPALKQLWITEQQKNKLNETAEKVLQQTLNGNGLQTQGLFQNLNTEQKNNITRETTDLPNAVMKTVFSQKIGNKNAVITEIPDGVVVSTVTSITKADPKKDEFGVGVIKQNLKTQTGEGLVNELMGAYADKIGVTVNEKVITDAFAAYQNQE